MTASLSAFHQSVARMSRRAVMAGLGAACLLLSGAPQAQAQTPIGFTLDWRSGEVCSVSCDGRPIMLRQSPTNASPSWVWIGVESDALFHLYRDRGVKVLQEPMNWSWAYEMKFEDPDGNVLWMGAESRNDLPMKDHA
jgi:hypothetical protein